MDFKLLNVKHLQKMKYVNFNCSRNLERRQKERGFDNVIQAGVVSYIQTSITQILQF